MGRAAVFWELGDVVPPPLSPAEQSPQTVTARLKAAASIARQLRLKEQLMLSERRGLDGPDTKNLMLIDGDLVAPLGDEALRTPPAELLRFLSIRLREYPAFEKRVQDNWKKTLPRMYGYDSPEWAHDPSAVRRVAVRLSVCLAADVTFAPYARGLLDAIAAQQAALRVDLMSVVRAIWAWGNTDYPALAYALTVARRDTAGEVMGFPSFTTLLRRVLSAHVESSAEADLRPDEVASVAYELSKVIMRGLEEASVPGTAVQRRLFAPVVQFVSDKHPDWLPDEQQADAEEAFARGAAPLVFEALMERRPGAEVAASLEALARAMRESVRGGSARA